MWYFGKDIKCEDVQITTDSLHIDKQTVIVGF